MNIDFTKYNRLFTFGCSFTEYFYPTWANILSKSLPNAEFYNLGFSGTSNPFIANRMVEANKKFKFCDTDLIVTMWTTTARETHYVRGKWTNPGNIFSQDIYSKEFVEKFADPDGYLMRDLATIELATSYMNNLPCKYIGLLSAPFDFSYLGNYNDKTHPLADEIVNTYSDLIDTFPESMFELEMNCDWECGSTYECESGEIRNDYHPNPIRYCNYLIKLGFPIMQSSIDYAKETSDTMKTVKHRNEFPIVFPYCHNHKIEGMW